MRQAGAFLVKEDREKARVAALSPIEPEWFYCLT